MLTHLTQSAQLMPHTLAAADYIVLDLETADPTTGEIEQAVSRAMDKWQPPANIKAADKIEQRREEAAQKIRDKAGLLDSAPVICVSLKSDRCAVLFDAMVPDEAARYQIEGWHIEWCETEHTMLERLREWLDSYTSLDTMLCGHNINGFDVPKLRARYLAHRLRLPLILIPGAENARHDTMREYPRHSIEYRGQPFVSLDSVCAGLGIPRPKQIISGPECPRLYREKQYAAIGTYCAIDALAAEQAMLLLTGQHQDFQ